MSNICQLCSCKNLLFVQNLCISLKIQLSKTEERPRWVNRSNLFVMLVEFHKHCFNWSLWAFNSGSSSFHGLFLYNFMILLTIASSFNHCLPSSSKNVDKKSKHFRLPFSFDAIHSRMFWHEKWITLLNFQLLQWSVN